MADVAQAWPGMPDGRVVVVPVRPGEILDGALPGEPDIKADPPEAIAFPAHHRVDRIRHETQAVPEDLDVPDLGNPEEPFDFTQQRLPRLLSLLEGPDPVVTTPEQAGVRGHLAREFFQVFLDYHNFFLGLPRPVLRRTLPISWSRSGG